MIVESFMWAVERYPKVRRTLWRGFYGGLAAYTGRSEYWTFMNYGYFDVNDDLQPPLEPDDDEERYPIYLYHRVAARVDLAGRDVLEVGCGRGGGVSYVKRYLAAKRVVGIDIARSAVSFCRRVHPIEGVAFLQGEAEALPLEDDSFDAVLNVESAHCYPSIERFLSEVKRVLRPGGHFLYADIHHADTALAFDRAARGSGLDVVERADISEGVIAALKIDSARRKRWSEQNAPSFVQRAAQAFVGVAGTRVPDALARGSTIYLAYVMRKPDTVELRGSSHKTDDDTRLVLS